MAKTKVGPKNPSPTHPFALALDSVVLGLGIGDRAIREAFRELAQTPTTIFTTGAGRKYGEGDPNFTEEQKEDWTGGRGLEDNQEDLSAYFDSFQAYADTPNRVYNVPLISFATGLRSEASYWPYPQNVTWQGLYGSNRFISVSFVATAFSAYKTYIRLRRVAKPGTLTFKLFASADYPTGTALQTVTVDVSTVTDYISLIKLFDWSGAQSLTNAATYYIVISGAATDNNAAHWEIGVDAATTGGNSSADGITYAAATFKPYFRVVDKDIPRSFFPFRLDGALYMADRRDDGTASHVYMNGDRSKATSATATTIVDTSKSWTTDRWKNAWVYITKGKGFGQYRKITTNASDTLTVATWDITPDSTSEFIIYATPVWQDISPGSGDLIDGQIRNVAVFNNIAIFAQGSVSTDPVCLKMRWDPATKTHQFDDDGTTDRADIVLMSYSKTNQVIVWIFRNSDGLAAYAVATAWLTDLAFTGSQLVGDTTYRFLAAENYGGQAWVRKQDSLYREVDGVWKLFEDRYRFFPDEGVLVPMVHNGPYLQFGWWQSMQQLASGSEITDVGPWNGSGLPDNRRGRVRDIVPWFGQRSLVSIDANTTGISSVLMHQGRGNWMELVRGIASGQRIRGLAWQPNLGTQPRLWIGMGGDLVFQDYAREGLNMVRDSNVVYEPESSVTFSTFDNGAKRLPKLFEKLTMIVENLNLDGISVYLEYQLDEEIGTTTWRRAGAAFNADLAKFPIGAGEKHRFRPRIRMLTSNASITPIMLAVIVQYFARTPFKRQWNLIARFGNDEEDIQGNPDGKPVNKILWLYEAAMLSRKLEFSSFMSHINKIPVVIEPPAITYIDANFEDKTWTADVSLTIREVEDALPIT